VLAALCMPFTYYGANRDQGTLFHFTGTLWGTLSPDLLLAMCKSIFGKSQQAVGIGVEWGLAGFNFQQTLPYFYIKYPVCKSHRIR
jgi:hypothetical protein